MADDRDQTDGAIADADTDPVRDTEFDAGADPLRDTDVEVEFEGEFEDSPGEDDPDFTPESDPVKTARRRHGTVGAVMAAGMLGIDIALGRKPKEEVPVVVDTPTEPTDIDTDGIRLEVDANTTVIAPALPRSEPLSKRSRRRGR